MRKNIKLIKILFIAACFSVSSASVARVLEVTNERSEEPGGLSTVVAQAQNGDTIVFSEPILTTYLSGPLVINKSITIDGGTNVSRSLLQYDGEFANIIIGEGNDTPLVTLKSIDIQPSHSIFSETPIAIQVNQGNLVCMRCNIFGYFTRSGPGAGISSAGGGVAFISSSVWLGAADYGPVYYGSGFLALVNTAIYANYAVPSLGASTGTIHATGADQVIYVRNSTLAVNYYGTSIHTDQPSARVNVKNSIIVGQLLGDDIRTSIDSKGYNLFGLVAQEGIVHLDPTDMIGLSADDIFIDRTGDGTVNTSDLLVLPADFSVPVLQTLVNGPAHNRGDPYFRFSDVKRDRDIVPAIFIEPIIEGLAAGDQYGGIYPRVQEGRIDIGALERTP